VSGSSGPDAGAQRHAVVVDPYSGAVDYAHAFHARGVPVIAVLSTPAPLDVFAGAWQPQEFDAVRVYDGDFAALAAYLRAARPLCVLPGNETAVELAEALVDELLPGTGNTPGGSAARRDKWLMAQALAAAGVPHVRQICATDPETIEAWVRDNGLAERRLVLKPPKSGGTDSVHVTDAGGDWRPYFDRINGAVNRFGFRNSGVLVQEYVEGTEYIVDTYSVDGRQVLTEVARYVKRRRGERLGLYAHTDFVAHDDPCVPVLADYVAQVADALGIRNGAAHGEVMMTADGPRLIEIGARLAGTPLQHASREATGDCQIDRAVRHHVDGARPDAYTLHRHVRIISLSVERAGVLRGAAALDAIRDLPTVSAVSLPHRDGETVPATVDLFTLLGWVVLASADAEAIRADHERIREIERSVVVEPTAEPPGRSDRDQSRSANDRVPTSRGNT
jgi:hypothetical protein